jgi:predicted nucleic acid-binding protein
VEGGKRPSAVPVVVDGSAFLEILIGGPRAEGVLQTVGGEDMAAPDLLNIEVLSVLRRFRRNRDLSEDRADRAVVDLLDAPVYRLQSHALVPVAWELRAVLSAYDACYVAAARLLRCALVTGDRRLAGVPNLGVPVVTV